MEAQRFRLEVNVPELELFAGDWIDIDPRCPEMPGRVIRRMDGASVRRLLVGLAADRPALRLVD